MEINLTVNRSNDVAVVLPESQRVTTVVESVNSITVGAVAAVSLNSVTNVDITNLQNNQILQYNSETNNWENVNPETAGSEHEIVEPIDVTNQDAGFAHLIGKTYASGTLIENILREILEPYNRTTISLNSLSVAYQATDGSYGAFSSSSGATLEVGRGVRVDGFSYTIADNTQTGDNSVAFVRGSSILEVGFADDNTPKTLSSVDEVDPSSPTSVSYKATAVDTGGESEGSQTILSSAISFVWKYRVKVGSSNVTSIASDAEAVELFNGLSAVYNQLSSESDFTVTADAGMDTSGNYTWIAYPASFGNLTDVLLAATGVLSDFESPVTFNITNDYGVTTAYLFYRSTYDNAFATGQQVTIDF